jgi:signal transduction histidine kinase
MYEDGATNSMIASVSKSLPQERRNDLPVLLVTLPVSQKQRRLAVAVIIAVGIAFLITLPYATTPLQRIDAFVPAIQGMLFMVELIIAVLLFAQYSIVPQPAILAIANGYLFTALMVAAQALTFPGAFTPSGLLGAGLQSANWLYYFWFTGFPVAVIFYVALKNVWMYREPSWAMAGLSISVTIAVAAGLTWIATTGEKFLPSILLDEIRFGPLGAYCSSAMLLVSLLALTLLWLRQRSLLDLWLAVGIVVTLPSIVVPIIVPFARFSVAWYSSRIYAFLGAGIMMVALFTEVLLLHVRVIRSNTMLERERSNKLMNLTALAASISHEVRQPLTGIAASSSALLRFLGHTPPKLDRVRLAAEKIVAASHHASQMLDDIRNLFGTAERPSGPVNLNSLALGALRTLDGELKDRNVVTRVDLASELPHVMGHSGQLQEVIVNLIQNAIDAMDMVDDAHRVLKVRTKLDGGDAISVEIEDTGPGIDPKQSDEIFDAFVTTKSRGMGLGLAISRMIVERHEGRLSVSSGNPHGAVFQIILPQMKSH